MIPPQTILIIDDMPDMIDTIRRILVKNGYNILSTTNGENGVELAQSGRPDLILLDVIMPGIDGYTTCQRLKEDPKTTKIPVIFLSAQFESDEKIRGFDAGGVDYIGKPVEPKELLARIKSHLSINQLRQELIKTNNLLEERVQERTDKLKQAYELLEEKEWEIREKFNDLKQKEWDLMLSEHRKATLVRAIPDLMFICTIEGAFLDFHLPEGCQYWTKNDVIGKNICDIGFQLELTNLFLTSFQNAVITRNLQQFTYECPVGIDIRYCDTRILALNKREVLGIITDITHQHTLELLKGKAILQIEDIMEKLQIYNDQIRNPLSVITFLAESLETEIKKDFMEQIKEINTTIDQVDLGFMESEKVRRYMKKYYFNS
jgi:DNA-binding response OmpR family regulator